MEVYAYVRGATRRRRSKSKHFFDRLHFCNIVDIDECGTIAEVCEHGECHNTEGSYFCVCTTPGYELSPDKQRCVRRLSPHLVRTIHRFRKTV